MPYTIELLIISLIKILLVIIFIMNNVNSENIAINLNFNLSLFFIGLLGWETGAYSKNVISTIKNINIVGIVDM